MAYEIGNITVDKEGSLLCEDDAKAERIAHSLIADGFTDAENPEPTSEDAVPTEEAAPAEDADAPESLTISMPKDGFTDEAIANLRELIGISDDYAVLLLQGGASMQFSRTVLLLNRFTITFMRRIFNQKIKQAAIYFIKITSAAIAALADW